MAGGGGRAADPDGRCEGGRCGEVRLLSYPRHAARQGVAPSCRASIMPPAAIQNPPLGPQPTPPRGLLMKG